MQRRLFITRSLSLALGTAGVSFAGGAEQPAALPTPGYRVLDLDLLDTDRRRPVPSRLYLPEQASPTHPVPLVVFSHGLGGSRTGYRYLASQWADAGVASLHPQHVGSDQSVWRGNPLELVQRLQSAASEAEAQARVQDLRFVLDQILASEQASRIDASRIAVAGHSYGANTAMLACGARVVAARAEGVRLRDERLQAAILISAPPLVGQGPAAQVLGEVKVPTLHITSLEDTINLPGYRSTVEDRLAIFEAMSRSARTLAVFNTGGHSIFTDRTTRSGPETSARIKAATRELCSIFLRQFLSPSPPVDQAQGLGPSRDIERRPPATEGTFRANLEFRQWQARHHDLLDRFIGPTSTATS